MKAEQRGARSTRFPEVDACTLPPPLHLLSTSFLPDHLQLTSHLLLDLPNLPQSFQQSPHQALIQPHHTIASDQAMHPSRFVRRRVNFPIRNEEGGDNVGGIGDSALGGRGAVVGDVAGWRGWGGRRDGRYKSEKSASAGR